MEEEVAIKLPFSFFRLWDIKTCFLFLKKRGSQGGVFYNEVNMEIEDIFALRLGLSSFWEIREVKFVQEPEGVRRSMAALI